MSRGTGRGFHPGGRGQGFFQDSITCQLCGKYNHIARDCWHRFDSEYAGPHTSSSPQAFYAPQSAAPKGNWFLDTGANTHVTPDLSRLYSYAPYSGTETVTSAGGHPLPIAHVGAGKIPTSSGIFHLGNLLHVPSLKSHLLSVYRFTKDNNCTLLFNPTEFQILDNHTHRVRYRGRCEQGLYMLPSNYQMSESSESSPSVRSAVLTSHDWHRRLGHPSLEVTNRLLSSLGFSSLSTISSCDSCSVSKSHKLSFPLSSKTATFPFQLIHSDIWGPTSVPSFSGYHYYISFIDDFTKFTWLYPLKRKSEAFGAFQSFHSMVQNQFGTAIKLFRTDNGKEYVNKQFGLFLQSLGILHQKTCPYTPEQNGVAERKHRHLIETVLTLLHTSHLPVTFWLEALATANFLINRLPKKSLAYLSPFEKLYHQKPDYSSLRVFGCLAYPHLRHEVDHKLQPRSKPCVFVGYESLTKGYRCFDPTTSKVYVTRHVRFHEFEFPYNRILSSPPNISSNSDSYFGILPLFPSSSTVSKSPSHMPQLTTSLSPQPQPPPNPAPPYCPPHRRTPPAPPADPSSPSLLPLFESPPPLSAARTFPALPDNSASVVPLPNPVSTHPMTTRAKSGIFKPKIYASTIPFDDPPLTEPTTYKQAAQNKYWCQAMDDEFEALQRQHTWVLVPPSSNQYPIGCKWVYRIKHNSDGSVSRYKARLVAKGYDQEYGLDYSETFSPVVKQQTVRVVLSLAMHYNWPLHQLDVSNAFLHGELREDIYMTQPPGYIDQRFPQYVCKLQKSLYGLKQAPRAWYLRLSSFLTAQGFTTTSHDTSLFIKHSPQDTLILLLYVDDIVITGSSSALIQVFIQSMHQEFQMKDLGPLKYFLGLEVERTSSRLLLHQAKYASELIHRAGVDTCTPAPTPISPSSSTNGADIPFSNPRLFRSLVGGLQYLTVTRPDIQYAVNFVAQKMHSPTEQDFHTLKRILRYVKGSLTTGVVFGKGDLRLRGYSDSDWANDPSDSRSTTGYLIYLGNNLISWSAEKQKRVSKSSTEAEYRALSAAASEIMWLTYILTDLHVATPPPILLCDNQSAICLTKNPVFHKRMKHVGTDCNFVREQVIDGSMSVQHVSSEEQLADFLTKPLTSQRFQFLISKLPLASARLSLRGDVRQNI